jgi:phosphoribosylformylglycinamidine cyclo-ligase
MLPSGLRARVRYGTWPVLPIFDVLREIGAIELPEMLRTFNMGVGMILAVPARAESRALAILRKARERAYVIGWVERGRGGVLYE